MVESWILSILSAGNQSLAHRNRDVRVAELFHLLMEIHKSNSSESFKKYPFTLNIMRHICELILLLVSCQLITMPLRSRIVESIKIFIDVGDPNLTQSLLHKLIEKGMSKSNFLRESKAKFLKDVVSSSDVWQGLDSASKWIIVVACISLAEEWMLHICRQLNLYNRSCEFLKDRILNCVQLFFFAEKHRNESNENEEEKGKFDKANDVFSLFLNKLSPTYLMHLVLKIFKSETKADVSIKEFPKCFSCYLYVCKLFFRTDFVSLVDCKENAAKIVRCLLWLNNSELWPSFSQSVRSLLPSIRSLRFVRILMIYKDLPEAVSASSSAFAALVSIVDHRVGQLSSIEAPSKWQQPSAELPDYPEVETFLRSNQEKMTFTQFANIVEARSFAEALEIEGPSKGFCVRVISSGNRKSARCDISKKPKYYDLLLKDFQIKKAELDSLVNLRHSLGQERARRLFDK